MSDTAKSYVRVEYNGTDATDTFKPLIESFSFTDNADGTPDTISITASNQDNRWFKKKWIPQETDYIKAWIGVKNWTRGKSRAELFCGKFQLDTFSMRGYPQTIELEGISIPINKGFNSTVKTRTWETTDTQRILQDIADNADVSLIYEADPISVKELSQTDTDMGTAYSLCQEYGLCMKVYNDKLVIYDQTVYEKKDASYTIDKDDIEAQGGYDYTSSSIRLYDSVKIQYGSLAAKAVTYEYKLPGKSGQNMMYISGRVESMADAERKAKAELLKSIRNTKKITLTMMGETKYKAAENFNLSGFGELDGKYFIESVTHSKSWGRYTATLNAHMCVTDF